MHQKVQLIKFVHSNKQSRDRPRGLQESEALPLGKTRYPFHRRLGGPQGRSGWAEKSCPHRDSIPDRPVRNQSLY